MIKSIKKMMAVMAAVCLAGAFTACSSGDGDDPFKKPEVPFETEGAIGNVVEFKVNENTTGTANKITLKYRRSEKSAAEKIILQGAKYNVRLNDGDTETVTGDLVFALNKYGSCFDYEEGHEITAADREACGCFKEGSTEILDADTNAAEYQCELSYAKKLVKGDVVKFQVVSGAIAGEGKDKKDAILPIIKVILIDADASVDYYKEVFEYTKEDGYPLVIKSDAAIDDGEDVDAGLLDNPVKLLSWNQATVPAAKFEGLTASDSLVFGFTKHDEPDAGGDKYQKVEILVTPKIEVEGWTGTEKAVVLTGAQAAEIAENGLTFQGHGLNITSLTVKKGDGKEPEGPKAPEAGEEMLESAYTVGWSDNTVISGAQFEKATTASKIVVKYVGAESRNYFALKIWDKDNNEYHEGTLTGASFAGGDTDPYAVNLDEDKKPADETTVYSITYAPSEAEWAALKTKGLMIGGNGIKVTSIVFTAE